MKTRIYLQLQEPYYHLFPKGSKLCRIGRYFILEYKDHNQDSQEIQTESAEELFQEMLVLSDRLQENGDIRGKEMALALADFFKTKEG